MDSPTETPVCDFSREPKARAKGVRHSRAAATATLGPPRAGMTDVSEQRVQENIEHLTGTADMLRGMGEDVSSIDAEVAEWRRMLVALQAQGGGTPAAAVGAREMGIWRLAERIRDRMRRKTELQETLGKLRWDLRALSACVECASLRHTQVEFAQEQVAATMLKIAPVESELQELAAELGVPEFDVSRLQAAEKSLAGEALFRIHSQNSAVAAARCTKVLHKIVLGRAAKAQRPRVKTSDL